MTVVQDLAAFVVRASWDDLSPEARTALKTTLIDALGCAIGAQDGAPVVAIRAHVDEFGGAPLATLIGGGRTSPTNAALYNGALVRYLDFNDSYLAPGETCHPSDNIGAVLAGAEFANATGRELLTAIAVAYEVQGRLSDAAPVRAKGFDHTTHGAYAASAGVAKALRLPAEHTANAIAIAGTAFNALRVTRTGELSNWKGLAAPQAAASAAHAAFLARRGITGPGEVFEGNKGFMDAIAGRFDIDWEQDGLERLRRVVLKRYNAEVHSQAALEAVIELREAEGLVAADVARVDVEIFDVAWNIIGGGEEGSKRVVRTKEEADHSLPYMIAVALCDGAVTPAQYDVARIDAPDVQSLLHRVSIRPDDDLSRRFPDEHACRVAITTRDGRVLRAEKHDYEGFHTRPMGWATVTAKFALLTEPFIDAALSKEILETVSMLEDADVADLTHLLARTRKE